MSDELNPLVKLRARLVQEQEATDRLRAKSPNNDYWQGRQAEISFVLGWIDELLPIKIDPCPFCDDDNVEIEYVIDRFVMHCTGCACRVDFGSGPNDRNEMKGTIGAFNSRADSDKLAEIVKAARHCLGACNGSVELATRLAALSKLVDVDRRQVVTSERH